MAALVKQAPPLEGWEIIGFKRAQGCEFVLKHEGARIDVMKMWFLPFSSRSRGFGVRLGCPAYKPKHDEAFRFAALRVLDVVLGEVSRRRSFTGSRGFSSWESWATPAA